MATVPDLQDHPHNLNPAELAYALAHGAVGNTISAAVCLIVDMPGAVHTHPGFAKYLTIRKVGDHVTATVDWPLLGADLISGHTPTPRMVAGDRALLMIAASLGGGPAIHLGELVACLDPDRHDLAVTAVCRAGGRW